MRSDDVAYSSQTAINNNKLGSSMGCDSTPNNHTFCLQMADVE